ncbi:hypothetical protein IT411_02275 [Candidatus Peregrinibacteria bacterium]|nr:hypothetical protein [Candidatus Peregrinibacteria bacterium]
MAYQIDQQFILKLNNLIREILIDESRFVFRNDQQQAVLHDQLFTKNSIQAFASLPGEQKEFFKKYFYASGNINQPRVDVPFTDSPDDQAFFFDQIRTNIRLVTFNYDRMDFLRPSFVDAKAANPEFSGEQSELLFRSVLQPFMHGLEQRAIAQLEKEKSGKDNAETDHSNNPYAGLGQKLLVKGISGQFDTILTYNELAEIVAQQELISKQAVSPEDALKQLKEFLAKRFPDKAILLDSNGNITTFQSVIGLSAAGSLASGKTTISFSEALRELKMRQGRFLQFQSIIESKGTLGFANANFQVINANGITTSLNGLSMVIDQSGEGNNAVFFVMDNQGVMARVVVDVTKSRLGEPTDLNISIYQKPEVDDPVAPKLKVTDQDLPKLKTPLLQLYANAKATGEFKPVGVEAKGPNKAEPVKAPQFIGTKEAPIEAGSIPAVGAAPLVIPVPKNTKILSGNVVSPNQPMLKLPASKIGIMPKIKADQAGAPADQAGNDAPAKGPFNQARPLQAKVRADDLPGQPGAALLPKSKLPFGLIALGTTGLTIAGSLAGGLATILFK